MRETVFENPLSVFIFPSKQVRSQIPYLILNNTKYIYTKKHISVMFFKGNFNVGLFEKIL